MSLYTPNQEEKERFMSRAIELSNEGPSKGHGGPYGPIVVKDGTIIGKRFSNGHSIFYPHPTSKNLRNVMGRGQSKGRF